MRILISAAFMLCMVQAAAKEPVYKTPLSKYSKEWDNAKYLKCNTGANAGYMTKDEQDVLWILNMARMNPQLFRKTVLAKAGTIWSGLDTGSKQYYKTLDSTLRAMKPVNMLQPDSLCAVSARAHAEGSIKTNYVGHWRQTPESKKVTHFRGECSYTGISDPVAVVLVYLIDEYVPSLGHRQICLSDFKKLGVGRAPVAHSDAYSHERAATILDFY